MLTTSKPSTKTGKTVSFEVRLSHPSIDENQPGTYTLHQHRDADGLIVGYAINVDSVFCKEEVCNVVPVTLRWDALGVFESLELADGTALEKVVYFEDPAEGDDEWEAVPFTQADYRKLTSILKDESSLLKKQTSDSMLASRHKLKLDGLSGATPEGLEDAVVQGGALTCYYLWHWANGDVRAKAKELTRRHCDKALLLNFLQSPKDHYVTFALKHATDHQVFDDDMVAGVTKAMRNADNQRLDLCYRYLQRAIPDKDRFFGHLSDQFQRLEASVRVRLLTLLASEETLSRPLTEAMADALPTMTRYYEVHMTLNLLEAHAPSSTAVVKRATALLDNDNFFISRRAYKYLKEQAMDAATAKRVAQYRDAREKEGRVLE